VFVNSIGTYVDPAAAPPGPTPTQTSREEVRQRDGAEALLEACVPPPLPALAPLEPAEALGVEDESEPAIRAAPAASAITAQAPISRLPVMPTPREVE
jgi:hypothetical protein